ncbi:MAG: ATP-binding cassette domain-containing protein [Bacteroidota bacterium]|jgi:putative ABC transport system ATP-binding protein|nr:ATP-binding cassette domain-containing protein [Bacteroidota bacterium]
MLAIRHVEKSYPVSGGENVAALRNVDLHCERGSFVVIVGANGSGKSTLLNVLAGSEFVDQGSITLGAVDITRVPEHRRAAMIGRVFQDPFQGTIAEMSVRDNLALAACRGEGFSLRWALPRGLREEMRERVAVLGIGLEDRLDQPVSSLSGGQRQILTMLMATWHKPRLLLLDEHTAALDPRSADLVMNLTGRIIADRSLTVLMVTHSMHHAVHFGQRLLMMHRGRIVLDIRDGEKRRARPSELVARFEELRRMDRIDESVAALLREQYL